MPVSISGDGAIGGLELGAFEDVSGTPTDNQALTWDAATSQWVPETPSISGFNLADLSDVSGTPTDGQILEYDTGTSSWVPSTLSIPAAIAGIGSNVASAATRSQWARGVGTSDVTGLSVSITPTSASSKILVSISVNGRVSSANGGHQLRIRCDRNGTTIPGNNIIMQFNKEATEFNGNGHNVMFLDSPNTTSTRTYKLRGEVINGGTGYVNPGSRSYSSIFVAEVKA